MTNQYVYLFSPQVEPTGYKKDPSGEEVKERAASSSWGNCPEQHWKDTQQRATKDPSYKEAWTPMQMPDQKAFPTMDIHKLKQIETVIV